MLKKILLFSFIILSQCLIFQNTTDVSIKLQYDYGIVERQVDGDTIIVNINGVSERVRLLGVDTQESVHPNKPVEEGQLEQSQFTKEQLTGRLVLLTYDDLNDNKDFFGRLLQYVWVIENDGTGILSIECYNKILIVFRDYL